MAQNGKVPPEVAAFLKQYGDKVVVGGGAGTFGETWSPEKPGETITGKITDYRSDQGENEQDVISLDTKTGPRSVWLGASLAMQISKADVGSVVLIEYKGKAKKARKKGWSPARIFQVYKVATASKGSKRK